jgi:peptidyl-prolyl cis-trans isomerase D
LRIARIGPAQVAGVAATDQEISAYYEANKAIYAPSDARTLSQVVVQDQRTAAAIAQRAKSGSALAAAAAPAGTNAAVTSLKDQTRQAYAGVAGEKAAAAVFSAAQGAVVGPLQSDFGWVVVKVDSISAGGGKTLAQAKAEIATKLTVEKRKAATEELIDKAQTGIDDGRNFSETVEAAKLPVTTTPLIMVNGTSRADPNYKLPPELAPVLKAGFEIAPNDPPEIVALSGNAGYAIVSPAQDVPAAAAPLASIRDRVAGDWVREEATRRARATATQIAARASGQTSLADALKTVGVALPAPQPIAARRIQVAQAQGQVPPALRALFTTPAGRSVMVTNPQGGFAVLKVSKVTPGNALMAPGLIGQMANELGQAASQDYAQEFIAALRKQLKAKRNDSAIQAFKTRLLSGGS